MNRRIKCDVHTHTLYSAHAYSTIAENVSYASKAGLELLSSTDHFGTMISHGDDIRSFQFFLNYRIWPRDWDGVRLMRGMEADILSLKGRLYGQGVPCPRNLVGDLYPEDMDMYERLAGGMDYVIASLHGREFAAGASLIQTTEMYCRVMDNPEVLILGHIGRTSVGFDMDTVLGTAKEKHVLIELNEHSFFGRDGAGAGRCRNIAIRCAELGVPVAVSTDAHICTAVGRFEKVASLLEEIDFPEELVVCRSREAFEAAVELRMRGTMGGRK